MSSVSACSPQAALCCRQSNSYTVNRFSVLAHKFSACKIPMKRTHHQSIKIQCSSSSGPSGPSSGDNESRSVLDAFFLGKALAETLNERIESTVGEVLSTLGRLQAEQQKQVQEFQEDVLERAKRAKEQAAREAMEAQGLIPKSNREDSSSVANGTNVAINTENPSTNNVVSPPASSSLAESSTYPPGTNSDSDEDPALGVSNQD